MSALPAGSGPDTEPDLLYTELEEALRASVRDLMSDRCPPSAVAAAYDGDRSLTPPLWKALGVDLGLAALLVPAEQGGAGASVREAAVVLEELGRAVAPVPFLTSAAIGTSLLAAAGTPAADALLVQLATGAHTVALAVPLTALTMDATVSVGADGRLAGTVRTVAGAPEADTVLVPADDGAVWAVATDAVTVTAVSALDMTRPLADLTFAAVDGEVVVPAAHGADAVGAALRLGAALLAAEQVGLAQWCLEQTVDYLRQRRQFGRVLGSFQALKHRLADLYVGVELARAASRYAVALGPDHADWAIASATAKACCSEVAVRAAEEAVQLHGGIGMTWEHPLHLYLKRAKADQLACGSTGAQLDRLADLVDLVAP